MCVARGAARQAAELLGSLPEWPLALYAAVEHPAQPHVRAAYAAAFAHAAH